MSRILEITDVHLSIGDTSILNGVTFAVERGERVGIIGPNGSGKTTLFNCLSGFHLPQSGTIHLNNQLITKAPAYRRAQMGLGRVFQNFGIFREMTVRENIITALESRQRGLTLPWSSTARRQLQESMTYLESVGLADRAMDKAASLSGGQMRLLEIARTLAFGADIFLLDEPTAGVAPKMKKEVERSLKRLQELKKTILIIEHDISFIEKLCERIIVLDVGHVVLDGPPEQVRSNPLLHEIYFGAAEAH